MTIVKKWIVLSLILTNHFVFADRILITGGPTVLVLKSRLYIPPAGFTASTDYNYVLINGLKNVCYQQNQTNLGGLKPLLINVVINGRIAPWTCYPYDETYFTVTH